MRFDMNALRVMLVALTLTLVGCQASPDREALRSDILGLHKALIDAHLNKDVDYFARNISEDYFSVSRGDVRTPTTEEIRSSFDSYLNNTTFTEYRDLREPIIGYSKDGSIAWSIVQVRVAGRSTMRDGSEGEFDDTWAWITLYERKGDRWIRLGEVSSLKQDRG